MTTEKTPGKDGKFYTIYRIDFPLTNQYYIGQHISNNVDTDNYLGSGSKVKKLILGNNKYIRSILCYANDEYELEYLEEKIIGNLYKTDALCLNMIPGGKSSGFKESRRLGGISAMKQNKERGVSIYSNWWNSLSNKEKEEYNKSHPISKKFRYDWTGKKHKQETIEKMRGPKDSIRGEKNGNYGNKWIYNLDLKISITVPKSMIYDYVSQGWILGRVMDFNNKDIFDKKKTKSLPIDKQMRKNIKIENLKSKRRNELIDMYKVYINCGFESVKQQFNYKYSRNNLLMAFKKYIDEFVPQRGKRRYNKS